MIFKRADTAGQKEERYFKWVFFLFHLSAIFSSKSKKPHGRIKEVMMFSVSIVIMILFFVVNSSMVDSQQDYFGSFTDVLGFLLFFFFRITLSSRLNYFQHALKCVHCIEKSFNLKDESRSVRWIYLWASVGIIMYLIAGAFNYNAYYKTEGYILFNYNITQPLCKIIIASSFTFVETVYLCIPFHTFAFYYTLLCHQLYCILSNLRRQFKQEYVLQFEDELQVYSVVRKLIKSIDDRLSFLMFLSTISNAITMYYGINRLLRPRDICPIGQEAGFWIFFGLGYSAFIAMGVSGTLVHESSESVLEKLREIASNRERITLSQKQILFSDSNDTSLTVWKIVPIRRSFVIGTMGTVLTYCMLFKGMRTETQYICN